MDAAQGQPADRAGARPDHPSARERSRARHLRPRHLHRRHHAAAGAVGATCSTKPLHLFDIEPRAPYSFRAQGNYHLFGDTYIEVPNEPEALAINYSLRAKDEAGARVTIADIKGAEIAQLKGPSEAGLNRVLWNMRAGVGAGRRSRRRARRGTDAAGGGLPDHRRGRRDERDDRRPDSGPDPVDLPHHQRATIPQHAPGAEPVSGRTTVWCRFHLWLPVASRRSPQARTSGRAAAYRQLVTDAPVVRRPWRHRRLTRVHPRRRVARSGWSARTTPRPAPHCVSLRCRACATRLRHIGGHALLGAVRAAAGRAPLARPSRASAASGLSRRRRQRDEVASGVGTSTPCAGGGRDGHHGRDSGCGCGPLSGPQPKRTPVVRRTRARTTGCRTHFEDAVAATRRARKRHSTWAASGCSMAAMPSGTLASRSLRRERFRCVLAMMFSGDSGASGALRRCAKQYRAALDTFRWGQARRSRCRTS